MRWAQIKSHLRVLTTILRSIEAEDDEATSNDPVDLRVECLRVCMESLGKLEKMTKDLDRGLNGSGMRRRWTCLRKAMKEVELTRYLNELERAKTMLIMYQGWKNG